MSAWYFFLNFYNRYIFISFIYRLTNVIKELNLIINLKILPPKYMIH